MTAEELASNFGLPLEQIARNMFPDQPESLRQQLMAECGERENLYLAEHGGLLYPKLEETLRNLSEKYPLFIVSNCQTAIFRAFIPAIIQRNTSKTVNASASPANPRVRTSDLSWSATA